MKIVLNTDLRILALFVKRRRVMKFIFKRSIKMFNTLKTRLKACFVNGCIYFGNEFFCICKPGIQQKLVRSFIGYFFKNPAKVELACIAKRCYILQIDIFNKVIEDVILGFFYCLEMLFFEIRGHSCLRVFVVNSI